MDRRDFLSKGLAGIAGVLTLPGLGSAAATPNSAAEGKKRKLLYRTLGKTGLKLPIVSLGTLEATSEGLVRTALDAGIVHIATAPNYQNGRVEEFVGRLSKNYKRDEIILATDGLPRPFDPKSGLFSKDTDVARFEEDFGKSLKRLGVEYVDIFYLSSCARKESIMFEPVMKAMEKIRRDGKARFLGISTHSFVPEAVRAAADSALYDVVMLAYNFQIKDTEERKEAVAYAAGKGMGIVAMKTITGESWVASKQAAASHPKAALKWVFQNENIHTAVPGITTYEQLETDLSIMEDPTLTAEEKKYLQMARAHTEGSLLCQGCGTCLSQCSQAPDIPTLMRCYMYVYGYRDLAAAVRNIESVRDNPIACAACSSCIVKCPMGFDVRSKALVIIRLRDFPSEFFS
jgi:predicted aldo/keto reductase-like oxidoreductase